MNHGEIRFYFINIGVNIGDLQELDVLHCITFHFFSEMMESEGGKWEGDFREEVSD